MTGLEPWAGMSKPSLHPSTGFAESGVNFTRNYTPSPIATLPVLSHSLAYIPMNAVFGFDAEEDAEELFAAVRKSGMKYMMNETSTFHAECYAKRMQYQAGALDKIIYSEGEYYHDEVGTLGSYNPKNGKIDQFGWRRALVPMWHPTIESILLDKKPIVDVSEALNMTLAGVIAHKSALKDGEWLKIPQYG